MAYQWAIALRNAWIERISRRVEEIGGLSRAFDTLTTVLALPINIVAGFFGMNGVWRILVVRALTLGARRFAGAMTCRLRVESAEAAQGGNQTPRSIARRAESRSATIVTRHNRVRRSPKQRERRRSIHAR